MNKKLTIIFAFIFILCSSFLFLPKEKPIIYLIGDSTVHNSDKEQWGWGSLLPEFFDSTKISISNQAMAGRSTRTFIKEGRWDRVLSTLKKGDFVLMQFGHNEGSKPDTSRAGYRGVLKGTGEDSVQLTWPNGNIETVHTYGWYIRKFVRDAKAKGATPIVLSMIPRNEFREGKVLRADKDYGKWAKEIADAEGVMFIDLNAITADKYDAWGAEKVKTFFPGDHTHTNHEGAEVNAASIVDGIKAEKKNPLNKYLLKS
ncbi:rhamnogalacturonan acetylesterase [Flavisolibacter ginsenosidimutans]|uniref:Rhamnogalacturonan acetylesterase n=1 Tax=Flavisolibacter ginsenosidimutans TaxID=661481 RepID=A0A5B8UFQ1_9BACT|nr:rhamnogalacturonan acetylesterase [Flavisolibacter ginsenosidimutans]QEC55242.1 rhamnogalacturonan acetylesterase [Flavisolibacter ginsenosidimutans]